MYLTYRNQSIIYYESFNGFYESGTWVWDGLTHLLGVCTAGFAC